MEISGTVFHILNSQSGEGAKGPWVKHGFVIETQEQYPKKVYFTMFSKDPNSRLSFNEGDNVTVSFSVESREYNGRWYSDIKAYKITTEGQRATQNKPKAQPKPPPQTDDDFFGTPSKTSQQPVVDDTDTLPF